MFKQIIMLLLDENHASQQFICTYATENEQSYSMQNIQYDGNKI